MLRTQDTGTFMVPGVQSQGHQVCVRTWNRQWARRVLLANLRSNFPLSTSHQTESRLKGTFNKPKEFGCYLIQHYRLSYAFILNYTFLCLAREKLKTSESCPKPSQASSSTCCLKIVSSDEARGLKQEAAARNAESIQCGHPHCPKPLSVVQFRM